MTNKTFEEQIASLAARSIEAEKKQFHEAQTVLTVILPFIMALGYDIFSFEDVEAEHNPDDDVKGEKVDYALKKNGKVVMLLEAKAARDTLTQKEKKQLSKYFTPAHAKIAILTNGKEAWFYSDLNRVNVMDQKPFFKFNFQKNNSDDIKTLNKFEKNNFKVNKDTGPAHAIKYAEKLKMYLESDNSSFHEMVMKFMNKTIKSEKIKENDIPSFMTLIKEIFEEMMGGDDDVVPPSTIQAEGNLAMPDLSASVSIEKYEKLMEGYKDYYGVAFKDPKKTTFLRYVTMIHGLGDIREKVLKTSAQFYSGETFFVSIVLWKKALQIGLDIDVAEINDPKGLCIDRKGKGRIGIGDTYINVNEGSDFDYVFGLIKQAYDKHS